MSADSETLRAHMHSAAQLLQLPLAEAHALGVLQNLERIAAQAALVNEFVLQEEIEPAPIFRHE